MFAAIRMLLTSDVLAYYVFLTLLFASTSFGVFLLAREYGLQWSVALFCGLAFGSANSMLAQRDSPQTVFYLVFCLCLLLLRRSLRVRRRALLYGAAVLGGVQAYLSTYIFLFQTVACLVLIFLGRSDTRSTGRTKAHVAGAAVVYLAVAAPLFLYYAALVRDHGSEHGQPWDPLTIAQTQSLSPRDLARFLANNVLYAYVPLTGRAVGAEARHFARLHPGVPRGWVTDTCMAVAGRPPLDDEETRWPSVRRCAGLGLVLSILLATGLCVAGRRHRELGGLLVVGVILSMGPGIAIGGTVLPSVMFPFYRYLPVSDLFRVPSRAHALTLLGSVLLAGQGLAFLRTRELLSAGWRGLLAVFVVFALFFAENVPVPIKSYEAVRYARPDEAYVQYLRRNVNGVVLNLPCSPGVYFGGDNGPLYEWARECIYMNWQTYYRKNCANGVNGYVPWSRTELQLIVNSLPDSIALERLKGRGISHIIYHRNLVLPHEDRSVLPWLRSSSLVKRELANRRFEAFRLL
jgi:hypothetical protein